MKIFKTIHLIIYMIFISMVQPIQAAPRCGDLFVQIQKYKIHESIPYVLDFKNAFSQKKLLVNQELQQAVTNYLIEKGIQDPRLPIRIKNRALQLIHSPYLDWALSTASVYLTAVMGTLPTLPQLKTINLSKDDVQQIIIHGVESDVAKSIIQNHEKQLDYRVKYTKLKAFYNIVSLVVFATIVAEMIEEQEKAKTEAKEATQKYKKGLQEFLDRPIKTRDDFKYEILVNILENKINKKLTQEQLAMVCTKVNSPLHCSH